MTETIHFRLNGEAHSVAGTPETRLVDILREQAGLTATKAACRIGRCGSCLVLVDGVAVNGCLVMAYQLDGATVISPEGLDALPVARVVRQALIEAVAFQCGYCAPGFTVALTALLGRDPTPSDADIRTALEGNICRCTGYQSILRGAHEAVRRLREIATGSVEP
jgi:aerobic carbon-monoxide dehydrogenase small subunit